MDEGLGKTGLSSAMRARTWEEGGDNGVVSIDSGVFVCLRSAILRPALLFLRLGALFLGVQHSHGPLPPLHEQELPDDEYSPDGAGQHYT